MTTLLLDETRRCAAENGFDLYGVVDADRFDACQPKEQRVRSLVPRCRAVVLIGCSGAPCRGEDVAVRLRELQRRLAGRLPPFARVDPGRCALNFAHLAEAAGFGTVSPVTGLLLHPQFGPWIRIYAALLVEGNPFGELRDPAITDRFQPCGCCPQPCLETFRDPGAACCLGNGHGSGARSPAPQMIAVDTAPRFFRIRLTAQRLVPTIFRFGRPRR